MRLICLRPLAAVSCVAGILLTAWMAQAATRPRYGGVLRVRIRESFPAIEAPEAQRLLGSLRPAFRLESGEAGRAVYAADENAPGGRPFLDAVEIQMGRPLREQSIDLSLGKADIVEIGPEEARRPVAGRAIWSSA